MDEELTDRTFSIAHPFFVTDSIVSAALDYISRAIEAPRRWIALSAGSSFHRLTLEGGRDVIMTWTKALNERETLVQIEPGIALMDQPVKQQQSLIAYVAQDIKRVEKQYKDVAERLRDQVGPLPPVTIDLDNFRPRRRAGRPVGEHNEWAREEIALGRDRGEVFIEWAARQGLDLSDKQQYSRAAERFKQALRRGKTKL